MTGGADPDCSVCGREKVFVSCLASRAGLCEGSACFELLAQGCGTVVPAYFRPGCAVDPLSKPNVVFRRKP